MESYEALVHSAFGGKQPDVTDPDVLAWLIRRNGLEMSHISRGSHIGSVFSAAEIIAVLYTGVLHVDPKNPKMPDRDRMILSKGHAGSAVYAALAETGFFPVEQLKTHYGNGSILSGHVSHKGIPGVEVSTGSLGHGLAVGAGMALGAKMDGEAWRTWVVLGDGECDEGSVWEAALQAAQFGLDRLCAIVDYNHMQSLFTVEETLRLEPFEAKWKDFGWNAQSVNGHDTKALRAACERAKENAGSGKPSVILAHTVKGKGVSFMENNILWHYRTPQGEEYEAALKELEAQRP
ncbi:MAG: transketolase [Clostridiales bacterium]|nr:transketolase [Clostridiales bacterium]